MRAEHAGYLLLGAGKERVTVGGPRHHNRVEQAFYEFLRVPLGMVAGWLACAGIVIAFDRGLLGPTDKVHGALASVVPPQSSTILLRSVVPGLITLNSIVFFVLVMAVQHQSSNYSPVVFDQFLRRKSNQAFFAILVGETAYAILVLALVPSGHTVLAGTVALAGIVTTLVMLLAFIYSTVDQMRPSAIVWMIQHLALRARRVQEPLLARCRAEPELEGEPSLPVHVEEAGYIVHIDGTILERAVAAVPEGENVEIDFRVSMGDHVVPGKLLGHVRGADRETREQLAAETLRSVMLGRMPNIDHDSGHAVDHLGNIAWAAATTHDPQGARVAIRTLHSLLAHWGHQPAHDPERYGGSLPIVYRDRSVTKVLDALASVVAGSAGRAQHQSCSYALAALAEVLPRMAAVDQEAAVNRLRRVLPTARQHLYTGEMEEAFDAVYEALSITGFDRDSDRVAEIKREAQASYWLGAPAAATASEDDGSASPEQ